MNKINYSANFEVVRYKSYTFSQKIFIYSR